MRKAHLKLVGVVALVATAIGAGCSNSPSQPNTGSGGASNSSGGSGNGSGGAMNGAGGSQNGSGGAPEATENCTDPNNITPCGGSVVGTWNVASYCLELSGDMDVSLSSLGCKTVPVTGSLETSGRFVANADGTYSDQTTTTGTASFPLEEKCLSVSSVATTCNEVGSIFEPLGWTTATCSDASGSCQCELTLNQQGGMGAVLTYVEPTGRYTAENNTLTASNAKYSYCSQGDTLRVTPEMSGLTGNIILQKDGTSGSGSGGGDGSGGSDGEGSGGSDGSGGAGDGSGGGTMTAADGPCDIYQAAGNVCVAAHSTVRSLFSDYDGPLYQVRRASDNMTKDIPVLSPGGFADAAQQTTFCDGTSCVILAVYDQSGHNNVLYAQMPGGPVQGNNGMNPANAAAESLTVNGHQVFSLFTRPAQAYWNDGSKNDMPLGAEPQGIYMVTSGEHFNGGCCYNYGNGQLDRNYHGGPTMDSVYFGNNTIWSTGEGQGPWVMADMEDGMLANGTPGAKGVTANKSLPFPYVTAMEKNDGTTNFALKGGDATSSNLQTMWSGPLPGSKKPMKKEGGVLLGAGGDCCYSNNNASEGTFYEGAIVTGYPSDATDLEIHANIVEARYGK